MLRSAILALVLFVGPYVAWADSMVTGDPAAGAELYATQCMSCHGSGGNSIVPTQPIVAGLDAEYLVLQMRNFRDKVRDNAIMWPFASQLTDADIDNLSVYLESQPAGLSGAVDSQLAAQGEIIYRNGIPTRGVPNCTGCHGPAGLGIPPLYPRLSGQHAAYTANTLTELRDGNRPNAIMNEVAANLSDAEIAAVAEYIAGLH